MKPHLLTLLLLFLAFPESSLALTTFVFKNHCLVSVDVIRHIDTILGTLKSGGQMTLQFEHQIVFIGIGNNGLCQSCHLGKIPISPYYVGAYLNYFWRPEDMMVTFNDASSKIYAPPIGVTSITLSHSSGARMRCDGFTCTEQKIYVPTNGTFTVSYC
ncbi:hypothetical protein L596_023380 [Steinernema carpocapsae]|uniref:Uncharacterized protein n=1 Tax=Steinernema carpocapsae TaxID=34508 RepID=A0A4U5MDI9_STECR|nr:hypothetical protein L596_023380 [Steinernema carpocapsae]